MQYICALKRNYIGTALEWSWCFTWKYMINGGSNIALRKVLFLHRIKKVDEVFSRYYFSPPWLMRFIWPFGKPWLILAYPFVRSWLRTKKDLDPLLKDKNKILWLQSLSKRESRSGIFSERSRARVSPNLAAFFNYEKMLTQATTDIQQLNIICRGVRV